MVKAVTNRCTSPHKGDRVSIAGSVERPSLADFSLPSFGVSKNRAEGAVRVLEELAHQAGPDVRLGTKDELRALCGVSVGTFNEALKIAQNRGVVSLRPGPGGGIFSKSVSALVRLGNLFLALDQDENTVAEAVHVRNALDALLMDDAVGHASADDIATLYDAVDQMEEAVNTGDAREFMKTNWQLHAIIASISPNSILSSFYLGLLEVIEQHTLAVQPTREQPLDTYIAYRLDLHRRMVDAIRDRDLERARALVEEHNTENYLSTQSASSH